MPKTLTYLTSDKLFYVWLVVVIGSNLQTLIFPHLDWVLAGILGVMVFPSVWARRSELPWSIFIGPALIVGSILLTSVVSEAPFYDVAQAGKLAVMLVGGLAFFILEPGKARMAVRTYVALVAVNAALLLFGAVVPTPFAGRATTDGRYMTFLNVPGTLGAVGLCVLVYGFFLLASRPKRLYGTLVVAGSLVLVYFENSRTVTPLAILAAIFAVAMYLWERPRERRRTILVFGGGAAVLLAVAAAFSVPIPSRFGQLIALVLDQGIVAGLASSDPIRASMVEAALEAVSAIPILGNGMGTLGVDAPTGWTQVHMAYLQLWADAGLIAFIGFAWLVVEWIRWVPRALWVARLHPGSDESALIYNSIFVILAFALTNLLHTFSTEWAQWLPYLVSYSLLYHASRDAANNASRVEAEVSTRSISPSS